MSTYQEKIAEPRAKAALLRKKAGVAGYVQQQQESAKFRQFLRESGIRRNPVLPPSPTTHADFYELVQEKLNDLLRNGQLEAQDFIDLSHENLAIQHRLTHGEPRQNCPEDPRHPAHHMGRGSHRQGAVLICFKGDAASAAAKDLAVFLEESAAYTHHSMSLGRFLQDYDLDVEFIKVHDCVQHPLQ